MRLDEALVYLDDHFKTLPLKNKDLLKKTFVILEGILPQFNEENLGKLCEIETINPDYFPGLAYAAAKTLFVLYNANPQLEISYLLELVTELASRSRPWESLSAFSRIAESCPKQMTQDNIRYLEKTSPNILEICSHNIKDNMMETTVISPIAKMLSYFFKAQPKEINIKEIIEAKISYFKSGPSF